MKKTHPIICLDTSLPGRIESIAVYLIPTSRGAVLIDAGPGSTREILTKALKNYHFNPEDVTHVFLTHIHLDHAGAAGWLAERGATIHVHPAGAIHMLHPEKLLASARRIYGDSMDSLWGEFIPVPAKRLVEIQDGDPFLLDDVPLKALFTPGHAEHHISYQFLDTCFTGDIAGMRKPGHPSVNMPIVPPETHLTRWHESLKKLRTTGCKNLALSHYGFFPDVEEHLSRGQSFLESVALWLDFVMQEKIGLGTFQEKYQTWLDQWAATNGWFINDNSEEYHLDIKMGAMGLFRYWNTVRLSGEVI